MDWFADPTFWDELRPYIFPSHVMQSAQEETDAIIRLTGRTEGRVLDLCCGVGRHSLALARKGFSVTAVDLNQSYLAAAERAGSSLDLYVQWVPEDMRRFRCENAFDICINMFNSFGYFVSEKDDLSVLANIYASLVADGVLLLDTQGKEVIAKNIGMVRIDRDKDGTLYRSTTANPGWHSLTENWLLWKEGKGSEYSFPHSVYAATDLERLLRLCGFRELQFFGDFDGREYDSSATRLIAVATK